MAINVQLPDAKKVQLELARREADAISKDFRRFVEEAWHIVEPGQPFMPGIHIDAICMHLQAAAERKVLKLLVNVPPRSGKPVQQHTLVLLEDGTRTEIKKVRVGDKVLTHKGRFRSVKAVHDQGSLPVYKITTYNGRTVIAAGDHPFLTPRGWKEVRDLRVDDLLAVPRVLERVGGTSTDQQKARARLAGYFAGDGSCLGSSAAIAQKDPTTVADIMVVVQRSGFNCRFVNTKGKSNIPITDGVRPWLREIGMAGCSSYTKRVPSEIFNNSDLAREFIEAYFLCDGCVIGKGKSRKDGTERSDCCVEMYSVHRSLLEDIQHLLAREGIGARIRRKVQKLKWANDRLYESWVLALNGADDIDRFRQWAKGLIGPKKEKIDHFIGRRTEFDPAFLPDRIVSVEFVGEDNCYCLTVDEDESFTANDLATHNSSLISVLYPAWVWTRDPSEKFLFGSYAKELATGDSTRTRRIIESEWYQARWPHVQLMEDQNMKTAFENTATGKRQVTSVGGMTTGLGGTFLIMDDPHNVQKAESAVVREAAVQWFRESWSTRANSPDTVRIVVMQRVHQSDVSGYCLSQGDWDHLCLPMKYEGNKKETSIGWCDPREEFGELLWPERYNEDEIHALEVTLGSVGTAAQLQQRPVPRGGGTFQKEWLCFWYDDELGIPEPVVVQKKDGTFQEQPQKCLPDNIDRDTALASWDMAFKGEATSDYVVGQVWTRGGKGDRANYYLLAQERGQWDFTSTLEAVRRLQEKVSTNITLVEEKANGPAIIAAMRSEIPGLIAVNPEGGKESRASACAPLFEAGNVWLPHPDQFPWVQSLVDEICMFPRATYDDQVDAMTQALKRIRHREADVIELGEGLTGSNEWLC